METEKISIIYEDPVMAVLYKPAGVVTTREMLGAYRVNHVYLEDWVKKRFPSELPRGGIVHRLDKETSGLVLVGKNETGLIELKRIFMLRQVEKIYDAIVSDFFPFEADINMPVGRGGGWGKFAVMVDGKPARTLIRRRDKYVDRITGYKYSWLKISLRTGRTHQIRVHLNYLRYPIVGDVIYGGETSKNMLLNASKIGLFHPITKKWMEWKIDPPAYFFTKLTNCGRVD